MVRHLTLYPQRPGRRLWYLLADAAAVAAAVACVMLGRAVYDSVMALSVIATAAVDTGNKAGVLLGQVQRQINDLPFVGPSLRNDLNPLHRIPSTLVSYGYQELQTIEHLALLLAIAVAGIPLLIIALSYLPWRVRVIRNASALAAALHRPGAGVRAPTEQVLAARALYALPYGQLVHYTPDPIGDWRKGRYDSLARAALAAEGFDPWHYLDRTTSVEPEPQQDRWARGERERPQSLRPHG